MPEMRIMESMERKLSKTVANLERIPHLPGSGVWILPKGQLFGSNAWQD